MAKQFSIVFCAIRSDGEVLLAGTCPTKVKRAIRKAVGLGMIDKKDFPHIAIACCKGESGHLEYRICSGNFVIHHQHTQAMDELFREIVQGNGKLRKVGEFSRQLGVHVIPQSSV